MHVAMWLVKHEIIELPVEFAVTGGGLGSASKGGRTPHKPANTYRGGSPSQKALKRARQEQLQADRAMEERVQAAASSRGLARETLANNTCGLFGEGRGPMAEGGSEKAKGRRRGRKTPGQNKPRMQTKPAASQEAARSPVTAVAPEAAGQKSKKKRKPRAASEEGLRSPRAAGAPDAPPGLPRKRNRHARLGGSEGEEVQVCAVKHANGRAGRGHWGWKMSEVEESVVDDALERLCDAGWRVRALAGMCCAGEALTIEWSRTSGWGMFATHRDVKAGECVAVLSHGRVYDHAVPRSVQVQGGFQQYMDPTKFRGRGDMAWAGGFANEANTPEERNAAIVEVYTGRRGKKQRATILIASRAIQRYREVLVDYGSGEWEHRQGVNGQEGTE